MSAAPQPKVLIVYYSLTKQTGRVADAMTQALEARGCEVTEALIGFTDERWDPKLSQFPMKRPIPQIGSILMAQLSHKTGDPDPARATTGDYHLPPSRAMSAQCRRVSHAAARFEPCELLNIGCTDDTRRIAARATPKATLEPGRRG